MCGYEIEFNEAIAAVDFSAFNSEEFSVITHGGTLHFFTVGSEDEKEVNPFVKIHKRQGRCLRPVYRSSGLIKEVNISEFYHWRYVNQSTLVACNGEKLAIFKVQDGNVQLW